MFANVPHALSLRTRVLLVLTALLATLTPAAPAAAEAARPSGSPTAPRS